MKSLELVNSCLYIIDYNRRQMSEEELPMNIDGYFVKENELETIKQDLEVLEIIKNKKVEVFPLWFDIKTLEEQGDVYILISYNKRFNNKLYELTMEELLKLKQWLEGNE